MKKYNANVKGFSTGTGSETNSNSRLNVAVSGAVSRLDHRALQNEFPFTCCLHSCSELLAQAHALINKIKADSVSSLFMQKNDQHICVWGPRSCACYLVCSTRASTLILTGKWSPCGLEEMTSVITALIQYVEKHRLYIVGEWFHSPSHLFTEFLLCNQLR